MSSSMLPEGKDFQIEPPRCRCHHLLHHCKLVEIVVEEHWRMGKEKNGIEIQESAKFFLEFMNKHFPSEKEKPRQMSSSMPVEGN